MRPPLTNFFSTKQCQVFFQFAELNKRKNVKERKEINVPANILSATFSIGVTLFGIDYKRLLL